MRGRVVAAPGTAGGEVGDWKAIPEQSLAALRELQSHESIFDAQRQLAEARLETVAVRRQLLVGDLCRQLGLRGTVRLDLDAGRVEILGAQGGPNHG